MKTPLRLTLVAGVAALALAASCGSSGGGNCVTGQMIACTCNSGASGAQVCAGNAYTECNCSGGTGGGSANGGGSGNGGGVPSGAKRIFVTSAAYTGALGGLSGADTLCTTAAQGAVLGGQWVAWASDGQTDAVDRVNDVGPWYTIASVARPSVVAFNNKANLATQPLVSIITTEQGNALGSGDNGNVWTGTATGGHRAASSCDSWSASSDLVLGWDGYVSTPGMWTSADNNNTRGIECSNMFHIYCVEQ